MIQIKKNIKKFWFWILGFISVASVFASTQIIINPDLSIDEKIINEKILIKIEKEIEKQENGKYKHIPKYEKDGVFYTVHEYEMPDGEIGYQIYIETPTFRMSTGTGVLAEHRSYFYEIDNIATTTL